MNYEKFVKKQNELFCKGQKDVRDYRRQWDNLILLVKNTYEPLGDELRREFKFEFFYLKISGDYEEITGARVNQNSIAFSMGNHPTGIIVAQKGQRETSTEAISESGGSLVFSQGPTGTVLVLLYPCTSDVYQYMDKYIQYAHYRCPAKITQKKLEKIIRIYFKFMYMTSYVGKVNFLDRLQFSLIKARAKFDLLKTGKSFLETVKTIVELKSGIVTP